MAELLRNAWLGWFRVTQEGKVMALFLAALLFLWIGYKREKHMRLLRYSTAAAVCCIVPVTAVALMLYQTRFYDYEWIWSVVPVTVVTAYAGTKVLAEYWQGFRREAWRKGLPVTAGLLAASILCMNLSGTDIDRENERECRAAAESIMEIIEVEAEGGSICVWAPRRVMEYVRRLDGSILLPYGRNMWDEALGAYSYDTYPEETKMLYQWMCIMEETCTENDFEMTDAVIEEMKERELSTSECLQAARRAGVNLLILPGNINRSLFNEVLNAAGVQPKQNSGYYFFWI